MRFRIPFLEARTFFDKTICTVVELSAWLSVTDLAIHIVVWWLCCHTHHPQSFIRPLCSIKTSLLKGKRRVRSPFIPLRDRSTYYRESIIQYKMRGPISHLAACQFQCRSRRRATSAISIFLVHYFLLSMLLIHRVASSSLSSSSTTTAATTATTASSSTASTSTTSYESVRALDRSGQAKQLKHAQAAADEQGRLILAIVCNNSVYVISPAASSSSSSSTTVKNFQRRRHQRNDRDSASRQQQRLVHRLALWSPLPMDEQQHYHEHHNFIVCTGIQADARWLIHQLQLYSKQVHLKYNQVQPRNVAAATAALKRSLFWGLEEQEQQQSSNDDNDDNGGSSSSSSSSWQSSIQHVWGQQRTWGRPVGVRTLVISISGSSNSSSSNNNNNKPRFTLQIVEPSGVIVVTTQPPCIACMGKSSAIMQAKLVELMQQQQYNNNEKQQQKEDNINEDTLRKWIQLAWQSVMTTTTTTTTTSDSSKTVPMRVEIISVDGSIEQTTWQIEV